MLTARSIIIITVAISLVILALAASQAPSEKDSTLTSYTRIECEEVVAGPLADVWNCWTTEAGAQTFFAPKTTIEPWPGGTYEILFMPDAPAGQRGAEDLRVLSVLPGEILSFSWNAPPQFPHARANPCWVVVTFTPVDDTHTRVRLVHLGFDEMKARFPEHAAEYDKTRDYFSQAWPKVLGWLKRRFDEGPRWDAQGNTLWK